MGWILVYHLPCSYLRAWYNGSTSASQAEDEGSIPFARTTLRICDASCGTAIKFSRPFVVGLIFGLFSLLDIMGFCCYGL